MKTVKFKNIYININNLKQYQFKTFYNKDRNELSIGFRSEVSKIKLDINHKKNVLDQDTLSKLDKKIQECIYDFIKSSGEFTDLDYCIEVHLIENDII